MQVVSVLSKFLNEWHKINNTTTNEKETDFAEIDFKEINLIEANFISCTRGPHAMGP